MEPTPASELRHADAVESGGVESGGVEGRVVIVTGAGQGIGRGIALHLGKHGASIVVAEWKEHRAERTVAELTELGVPRWRLPATSCSREQIDAMVTRTLDRFGKVDALVNNAQTFRPQAPMATVSEDDVDVFYTSGVKGSLWAMQAVHPHMQAAGWGRIVNFASAAGITGMRGYGRLQRVEGSHSGAHAHRGARMGP